MISPDCPPRRQSAKLLLALIDVEWASASYDSPGIGPASCSDMFDSPAPSVQPGCKREASEVFASPAGLRPRRRPRSHGPGWVEAAKAGRRLRVEQWRKTIQQGCPA